MEQDSFAMLALVSSSLVRLRSSSAHTNRRCLTTQLKRQSMPCVVQHLLDAGLPLQAATQLGLWAQREGAAHATAPLTRALSRAATVVEDDDDSCAFEALRPVSAVLKMRAAVTTAGSRPRSSIGMSRALSPVANQTAAAAAAVQLKPQHSHSPTASITSSTPTNIIVRSFRDIEHRAQLLQRAKTSSARLNISSQPLVIPNVQLLTLSPAHETNPRVLFHRLTRESRCLSACARRVHSTAPPLPPRARSRRRPGTLASSRCSAKKGTTTATMVRLQRHNASTLCGG